MKMKKPCLNSTQIARIVDIDRRIREGEYPDAAKISEDYGRVSERTIKRDFALLRDHLCAPLKYNHTRKGYYYEKPWPLPEILNSAAQHIDPLGSLFLNLKALYDKISGILAALERLAPSDEYPPDAPIPVPCPIPKP